MTAVTASRLQRAAIVLASVVDVIDQLASDDSAPGDRSSAAKEQRRRQLSEALAEFRAASRELREAMVTP